MGTVSLVPPNYLTSSCPMTNRVERHGRVGPTRFGHASTLRIPASPHPRIPDTLPIGPVFDVTRGSGPKALAPNAAVVNLLGFGDAHRRHVLPHLRSRYPDAPVVAELSAAERETPAAVMAGLCVVDLPLRRQLRTEDDHVRGTGVTLTEMKPAPPTSSSQPASQMRPRWRGLSHQLAFYVSIGSSTHRPSTSTWPVDPVRRRARGRARPAPRRSSSGRRRGAARGSSARGSARRRLRARR